MRAAEITHKLKQHTKIQSCYHDDGRFMRGGLLEVTFEPVFIRYKKLKSNKILPRALISLPPVPILRGPPPGVPGPGGPEPPAEEPVPERKRKKVRFPAGSDISGGN